MSLFIVEYDALMVNKVRPFKKVDARPLTEADKYDFLPYISKNADQLPSESDTYKSDKKALSLIADLKAGKDVSGQDFSGVNLKGAHLSGFNLAGINLQKANLTGTDLSGASLIGADLSYAYLDETNLNKADMTDIILKGVVYKKCSDDAAQMDKKTKSYLQTLLWLIEQIEQGKIRLPELPANQLYMLDLRLLDMTHVDVTGVDLSPFVLDGVNLSGMAIDRKKQAMENILFQKQEKITLQKIMRYAFQQAKEKLIYRAYAKMLNRPKKKSVQPDKLQEAHTQNARVIDHQSRKVRTPKTHLKKRDN